MVDDQCSEAVMHDRCCRALCAVLTVDPENVETWGAHATFREAALYLGGQVAALNAVIDAISAALGQNSCQLIDLPT